MQNAIAEQFQKIGSDRITVTAGGANYGPAGASLTTGRLTDDDVKLIKKVSGVKSAMGVLAKTVRVEFNKETRFFSVYGGDASSEAVKLTNEIGFFDIESGRQLKTSDGDSVIAGYKIAKDAFKKEIKTGDTLLIEGKEFDVVGIQKKAGTGIHDTIIRMAMLPAREIFDEPEELSMIFVKTDKGTEPSEVGDRIKEKMRKDRGLREGEEDFSVQTSEQAVGTFRSILLLVQVLLIGIAAISLVVGGTGIMNTMYASVLERTNEIGIMKSVGAKNRDVMLIFIIESGMIGLTGGAAGTIMGIGISKAVELAASTIDITILKISFSPLLIAGALAFSFTAGVVSGTAPAVRAARLKPVDALRKK